MQQTPIAQSLYCTRAEIRDEYGWSDAMIKRYLGEPDRVEKRRSSTFGWCTAHLFLRERVLTAQATPGFKPRRGEPEPSDVLPSLLDAVREASRSAHRWRDRAADRWNADQKKAASTASAQKKYWYSLKDAGITAMHRAGDLRYIGVSPQNMAIYEYDDGGMACLHSTLHPVGVERIAVEGHPEKLLVPAKKQKLRLIDVEIVLQGLPSDTTGYERSEAPRFAREPQTITCWRCGEEGHMARECSLDDDW
jgi:hypothetical protein